MRKLFAISLTLLILVGLVGCGKTDAELKEELTPAQSDVEKPASKPEIEKKEEVKEKEETKTFEELAAEENEKVYSDSKDKIAEDKGTQPKKAIAYLNIPGTTVDDWVMWAADNNYFLRKDNSENYSFSGCYYLDQECRVKPMSKNVVIYGHNITNKPDGDKFASLLQYKDLKFLQENQNIFLKTPEGVQTYKVAAAFYSDINWDYIKANPTQSEMDSIIAEYKSRSQFVTSNPMTNSDKYITLSTCSYEFGKREDQRWVVVGRLMKPNEKVDTKFEFSLNTKPKEPDFDKKPEEFPVEAMTEGYKPPNPDAYKDVE